MSVVYVNGQYLDKQSATVSVFDRGFLFADAVYEVVCVFNGKLIDFDYHFERLERSSGEIGMSLPLSRAETLNIQTKLIKQNNLTFGFVYIQVTRGAPEERDFCFPDPEIVPKTVVSFTQEAKWLADDPAAKNGIQVVTVADLRWHRRDIKSVQLLYPSMAKMVAVEAGADDAWLVENGYVTEGTNHNAFIVVGNSIITRQRSKDILHGTMRAAILKLAADAGCTIKEQPFTVDEAQSADEAFVTSSGHFVTPVVAINSVKLSGGVPGPISKRLRANYLAMLK